MTASDQNLTKEELSTRLNELIDEFPVNQQLILLKHLIRGNVQTYLTTLVNKMTIEKQEKLLDQLESIKAELSRESVRKLCKLTVDYETQDNSFKDYIQDVSTKGVFIKTSEAMIIGQEVLLSLTLPGENAPMKISGRVVRSEEDGYGVKFENLNPEGEDIIETCLQELEKA